MNLLRIELIGRYKCLENCEFFFNNPDSPISAFIGLNGSGKSQLMELIAEGLCYIERSQRRDFSVRQPLPFALTLDYRMDSFRSSKESDFRIRIEQNGSINAHVRPSKDETWQRAEIDKIPFPSNFVGYSSGNNQNLERAFLKNHLEYNRVLRVRELRQEKLSQANEEDRREIEEFYGKRHRNIFPEADDYGDLKDSDTERPSAVFLDYDSTTLILAGLSLLSVEELDHLFPNIEFCYPISFEIHYNLRGLSIASDFYADIKQLRDATRAHSQLTADNTNAEDNPLESSISIDLRDLALKEQLQKTYYYSPLTLFLKLYKLQLLGARKWQARDKSSLRQDAFFGNIKKPLKTALPIEVRNVQLCNSNDDVASFDDLSDGEAQMITILGGARLFSEEETLFIFDEPEAHLNPHWRTNFHKSLARAIRGKSTPGNHCLVSTHSPFMVASLKKESVFHFERNNNEDEPYSPHEVTMLPAASETYGASIEVLMKQYFDLNTLMPENVIKEIKRQLKGDKEEAKAWIKAELGESMEKAYLLRKLEN